MPTAALQLPCVLTHLESAQGSMWLDAARQANWQIDASQLQQFDSSALALLLDLRRAAQQIQAPFALHHAPEKLTQLAALYGVSELFDPAT